VHAIAVVLDLVKPILTPRRRIDQLAELRLHPLRKTLESQYGGLVIDCGIAPARSVVIYTRGIVQRGYLRLSLAS
jgi:hypothetical protein